MIFRFIRLLKRQLVRALILIKALSLRFSIGLAILLFRRALRFLLESRLGREIFYKSLPPNKLIISTAVNELYIVNSSDLVIGMSTFCEGRAFDSMKIEDVCNLLPKGHKRKSIIDIGANIGSIGIHALANNYFTECIAFEPEPGNFRLLKANVALNSLDGRFSLNNLALSNDSAAVLKFELCKDNHGDHRVRIGDNPGLYNEPNRQVISVESSCLDVFAHDFARDSTLIWMDTQGFEGHVLAGAKIVISKQIPIVMEFWPYGLKRSDSFDLLLDVLGDSKYRMIIDLKDPRLSYEFSRESLIVIAEALGFEGEFTDLLIL